MYEIWKFQIKAEPQSNIKVPSGTRVLSVGTMYDGFVDRIFAWGVVPGVTVDRDGEEIVKFQIVATGQPYLYMKGYEFINTVKVERGLPAQLIFHVFIEKNKRYKERRAR